MRPEDDQLTILLTLRSRHAYTLRWLAYASQVRFPFTVYIADGSLDDRMTVALADPARFPHVRYEYRRYPPDGSYADFYAKVADALSRIHTPFVAMGDNDDFFVVPGLSLALTYLSAHPDYVACGGQMASFWVAPRTADEDPLYGDSKWKCSCDTRELDAERAHERLRSVARWLGVPIYHHVRRTQQVAELFGLLRALDFKDIFLAELFLAFLTATRGKIRHLNVVYMAKQLNSPGSAAGAHLAAHGDWLGRMLVPSWSGDFARFLDAASTALANSDSIPMAEAQRHVTDAYRMAVAPVLVADLMTEPTATLGGTIALGVTRRLLALPSEHPLRRFARAMYRRVPWISPDVMQGTELRATRVAGAASELSAIHRFLTQQAAA
jgi:glycosyltransferase domain-containing protein